jgi:protein-disulfide isomerase
MHKVLFAHQDALLEPDLVQYATDLDLDVERFLADLHNRKYALRVQRDIVSADDSGAVGTPTFFVNGRRHQGNIDVASLAESVRLALTE